MEKVVLLRQCPLLASSVRFSPSCKVCWHQKQRLLSNKAPEDPWTKRQGRWYPGVPLTELVRGWFLYNLFRSNYLVNNGLKIMQRTKSLLGWPLTERLLKGTIFSQFVAEDTDKELTRKVQLYSQRKVGVVFAYTYEPLEEDQNVDGGLTPEEQSELQRARYEMKCDKCLESIDNAAHYVKGRPPIAAMKVTSVVDPKLLERLSALLNYSDKVFNSRSTSRTGDNLPSISSDEMHFKSQVLQHSVTELANRSSKKGKLDIVDWQNHFSVANLDQLHLVLEEVLSDVERPAPLTLQEHQQMKDFMRRMNDLGERAAARNVRLLIDAEQTYYQPAIRSLVVHHLMKTYNKDQPIIYNTLQSYLKSSYLTLRMEHTDSKRNNYLYAVKVVRGAYIDEERRLVQEKGYEDPIHCDKQATDSSYDKNINYLLSHKDSFLFVASHNLESAFVAMKRMSFCQISPQDSRVVFGQLLGMADYISLLLAEEGYHVYKLLHYGEIRYVVPYLARRALENRGAMSRAKDERKLLGKAIRQKVLSFK